MKKKPLIFDIDGTLWDATVSSAQGCNNGLMFLGIDERITEEGVRRVTGRPFNECIDALLPGISEKFPGLYSVLATHEHIQVKKDGGVFYESVLAGIPELAKDFDIFLISNCQKEYMNLFLNFSKIRNIFTDVDCNGMSGLGKADMLQNMVKKYGLEDVYYIGDTASDDRACEQVGVPFLHVSYGFGTRESEGPSFQTFGELVEFLQKKVL